MRKYLILFLFCFVLSFSGCGSSTTTDQATEPTEETTETTETTEETATGTQIAQAITFGNFTVSADSYNIEDDVLTLSLTITNNSPNGKDIDSIVGITADQAGTVLSGSNNTYDGTNNSALSEYVDPGQTRAIELKYKLETDDNIFNLSIFNDSSLGLSDQNLGACMDIQIDPANNTFEVQTYNESENQ